MVVAPDLMNAPFVMRDGFKFFELTAHPVEKEILPGVFIRGWGYNGCIPGPMIQVYPGDEVWIRVHNRLTEATSVHWHGLNVPNPMDGVPDVEPTPRIEPGHFADYRFRIINPPGTHMYHAHVHSSKQDMMGLCGGFIIQDHHPIQPVHRDYFFMLQQFRVIGQPKGEVKTGVFDIDPSADSFNFHMMNGRCFPFASGMTVKQGERVRIRLGNAMKEAHPMHLHGHQFFVTAADGNPIPASNRMLKNTINAASGETWDIEFMADNPGVWPFHCHIPHHMSNNLSPVTGGMFTTLRYLM